MGIRFRELSVSVLASDGANHGAYLVHAWNSCRFFAFCERSLFASPYAHGEVRISTAAPVCVHVAQKGRSMFYAEMRCTDAPGLSRVPTSRTDGGWSGPVFLPRKASASGRPPGKFFHARITGQTETFAFVKGNDLLTMQPASGDGAVAALVDSNFIAEQWSIRADARHAKSKTYQRDG
jgi:hypothetical protein